jgi:hypothetical protein
MTRLELIHGGEQQYRTKWILFGVPGDLCAYETALLNASIRRMPKCQLGFCGDHDGGVMLMVDVTAPTLSRAIEQSRGIVFTLIGRAQLKPPERVAVLAESG